MKYLIFIALFFLCGLTQVSVAQEKKEKVEIAPGERSPEFSFRDINNKEVCLKDFKGKYVYIDVWATWCGPCCQELPHLKKLERKFKGKKIAFVSISLDSRKKDWAEFVKKNKLGGVQLFANGAQEWTKAFDVRLIPRFILIDKKGRVVNAKMTRPSEPETEKTLSNLKGI